MTKNFRSIISIILIFSILISFIPTQNVVAEEATDRYPYTLFASSEDDGAIYLNSGNTCINGNICTNGTIISENSINLNGEKTEHATINMPNLWTWIEGSCSSQEYNINDNDITLDGEIRLTSDDIVATKHGNIIVDSANVDLNGLIYAPEGTITITAQNLNMNSVILIADKIIIQSPNININYNQNMAKEMVWNENVLQCKVSFNLMKEDAPTISDQIIEAGDYAIEPENPECEEYIFIGWYLDENFQELFDFSKTPITHDMTLYGRWYHETDETDTDKDELPDEFEKLLGTNPESSDTDGDGLSDYIECYYNLETDPCITDTDEDGIMDGDEDADEDKLSNTHEIQAGTEPDSIDTDGDGLCDGEEIDIYYTNPLVADTDSDTLSDRKEVLYGMDPLQFNSSFDITTQVKKGDTEPADISVSLKIDNISAEQAESLSIEPVVNDSLFPVDMPGYMGSAYDFNMSGTFEEAEITFEFEQNDGGEIDPVIYYYDEDQQELIPLDTIVTGNKASTITTHFSTYILLDRLEYGNSMEWLEPWDIHTYTDAQIILLTDDSGSMRKNDKYDIRLSVASSLIDDMPQNCKANVVRFSSDYERLGTMTDDREIIKSYLTDGYFLSLGNTKMNTALLASLDYFTDDATDTTLKMIVLLSDGAATDSDKTQEILKKAKQENVRIYCVGLGSSYKYFDSYLRPLAEKTDGEFYYAKNATQLKKIYQDITNKIDLSIDSDEDGLPDYYEDNLPCFNGVKLKLNKNNPDTDGDGLSDGEEIKELKFIYNAKKTKVRVYGKMKSNPTKKDSDGDGLLDNNAIYSNGKTIAPCDPKPLKYNGQYKVWRTHIAQMKTGRIGTTYKIEDNKKIIDNLIQEIKDNCPELVNVVETKLSYWSREFIIKNKDDMDKLLLKNEKEIRKIVMVVKKKSNGKLAAEVGAAFLNFSYDNLKIAYHSMPTTWQKQYGYNRLYDDVFKVGSNMNKSMNQFFYNGKEYVLWLWKGDYWNLGTGAEIGLYVASEESPTHYDAVKFTLPMELSLYQYANFGQLNNRFNWRPSTNQWWITGFDWQSINPNPKRLVSIGRIDFSQKREMGQTIYQETKNIFSDSIFDKSGHLWIMWK